MRGGELMKNPNEEAIKDTSRLVVFGAISTILSYGVDRLLPGTPEEVVLAVIVLITATLTYVDSYMHNSKSKALKEVNGILPF